MFSILLIVLVESMYSSSTAAVTSQMIGQYTDGKICELVAQQLRQSYDKRDGVNVYVIQTARCVQVK